MPNYKVKYRGEVHDIPWDGPGKPSKDELRLLISNQILEKDAPPKLDTTYKPAELPKPKDPFKNKYGQTVNEFELPEPYGYKTEKFLSTPLAPDFEQPETFVGGAANSLYKDFIQPLTTPRSIAQNVLTGQGVTKLVKGFQAEKAAEEAAILAKKTLNREKYAARKAAKQAAEQARLDKLAEPTPLVIPDTPLNFADEPIPRGASTYGITPRATDDPLLAHVPERFQPTTPTQQYFENMLPSVMRERIKRAQELGEGFVDELPSDVPQRFDIPERSSSREVRGIRFQSQDAVANDIQRKAREVANRPGMPPEIGTAINEVGDDIHNVSDNPAASMMARNLTEARAAAQKAKASKNLKYSIKGLTESGDTELKKMGPVGQKIWRIVADRDHAIRRESQAFRKTLEGTELADDVKVYEKVAEGIDKELKPQIDELIKQTPDPERTQFIIDNHYGKQVPDPGARYMKAFNDKVKSVQAITKLQTFAIKNAIGGNINTWLHSPTKQFVKSLGDAVTKSKAMGEFEDAAGATWNINKSMAEGMNDWSMNLYGGNWSENLNRKVAAWTGRGVARQIFDELKTNPTGMTSNFKRNKLEELLLEDADTILAQDKLTPRQELLAGGRHSEITQGLNIGRRMGTTWNNEYAQLPLIFRKYAFQQTKELKDAIKANPAILPKLFALSQISGEALGAIRAGTVGGVKGAIRGDIGKGVEEEFKGRTEYIGRYLKNIPIVGPAISENQVVNRVVGNVMEGWGLGLAADLMEGMAGGPGSFAKTLLGPALSQGADIIGAIGSFSGSQLGREALRALPIPYVGGAGIQRGLLPTPWQRKEAEKDDLHGIRKNRETRKGREAR